MSKCDARVLVPNHFSHMPADWKGILTGATISLLLCLLFLRNNTSSNVNTAITDRDTPQRAYEPPAPPEEFEAPRPKPPPSPPARPKKVESKKVRMPRVCLHNDTSDEYYGCRREALLKGCSEICDTTIVGEPSMFFNFARKHVDCAGVWMNEEIDASASDGQWPPPDYPPDVFIDDFRQHGMVQVRKTGHYQQRYSGGDAMQSQWKFEEIEKMVQQARKGELDGTYGRGDTNEVRRGLATMSIKGSRVLVIGSELPWVEACALEAGAAEVWTLEYGRIHSTHPKVKTVTPDEAREMYIKGTLPMFDHVLTYSSVEHSGLGRYGDALNPWGDMQAMARAWCVTKPGGQMLLGVMECGSNDAIEYNLHRCYKKISYTHLTANWKQEYRGTEALQTVMVFHKTKALDAPRPKDDDN
jgi:hypothetical protein